MTLRDERGQSASGRLARLGFADADRAARLLGAGELGLIDAAGEPCDGPAEAVLDALAETADPDQAALGLARVVGAARAAGADTALLQGLRRRPGLRTRLLSVLGASEALVDHLVRHPADWRVLADDDLAATRPSLFGLQRTMSDAVGADPDRPCTGTGGGRARRTGAEGRDALRLAYRRCLLGLAARDLTDVVEVDDAAGELADLAAATLGAALAVAAAELPADAAGCRLAVIGMGKCGARELNYVSDVDVVFVAEPAEGADEAAALHTATALAATLMDICSTSTAEGSLWPVDAALRPEGKAGPLVRTLASHHAYYERWAKTWEFQALLKARPIAGDLPLGRRYVDLVAPLVWTAAARAHFVDDVQAMRRRVESLLPAGEAERELKLGPGGLRDVEFAVQLLQLVHGRTDDTLRSPGTLVALRALAAGGYVGRDDAESLDAAYRFLRLLEHRLQLFRLRRTHLMPTAEPELRRLARSVGLRTDPVAELDRERSRHSVEVRRLHEKLFYRPLLQAVARLAPDEARLTPDEARARLEALGYADPAGALRHIEALTTGVSRRASIQRTLLPVLLGWFADSADPDAGLLAFRQVSEELGSTPWYLRLLRDEGAVAERTARLLANSRYAADLLRRAPEGIHLLAHDEDLEPRPAAVLEAEFRSAVSRRDAAESAVATVRGLRRRELLRTAAADLLGLSPLERVGEALSDVAAATLVAALDVAVKVVERGLGEPLPVRLAVIAMGRLGGREQGYGSDADVLLVHDPHPGVADDDAARVAHEVFNELRRLLALPAPDPPLHVDADLRPEGRQGPLTRSLASYAQYYERWMGIWEAQALLRARPVAGDAALGTEFIALADRIRWPAEGLTEAQVREIRRIKARVEAERLPRGADPALHTKLGRGGIADVEWTVQLLQLRHGHAVEGLRTTSTLDALDAATRAGLLAERDAAQLAEAWRLVSRVRNGLVLARGRPADSVPTELRELARLAGAVGYPSADAALLLEDYRRVTRRARVVVERAFYQ